MAPSAAGLSGFGRFQLEAMVGKIGFGRPFRQIATFQTTRTEVKFPAPARRSGGKCQSVAMSASPRGDKR
jgi:hypothetical protein